MLENKFVHKTLLDTAQIKRKYKYSILQLLEFIYTHLVDTS